MPKPGFGSRLSSWTSAKLWALCKDCSVALVASGETHALVLLIFLLGEEALSRKSQKGK